MKKFLMILKADLCRAFFSMGFVTGIVSTIAIFYFGSIGMMAGGVSAVAAFNNTYKYNNISQLLILTATFTYSASFCIDWQTKFHYPLIVRSKTIAYALAKCLAAMIMGGLSVAVGAFLFIGCICMTQPDILPQAMEIEVEFSAQAFGDLLMMGKAGLFFSAYLYIIFLQAAFFSVLGLLVSAYLPNKYAAYISPFILGFVLNQIANVLRLPIWLDPVKLATASILNTPAATIICMATATYLSLIGICTILFTRKVKRRMSNG